MNTDTEIARVLALAEKATPGPWRRFKDQETVITLPPDCTAGSSYFWNWGHLPANHEHYRIRPDGDATFIAAAHDMANLIRTLRDKRLDLNNDLLMAKQDLRDMELQARKMARVLRDLYNEVGATPEVERAWKKVERTVEDTECL